MVFTIGAPFTDQTPGSASKMNKMTVISGPGPDIAILNKAEYVLVKATTTGSGLTADHVYQASADATQWLDMSGTASHAHTSSTTGGGIVDIYRGNSKFIDLRLSTITELKKANWVETALTGGTAEDDTDLSTGERSIKLRTNATSGAAHTIRFPHLKIDFSQRSMFQFKARIETLSSLALHSGVNCDHVTSVDSNTVKYDAEVCTTTNNNWHLRTASGTDKSMSDTGTAATTARVGIKIEHLPDLGTPEADMYIGSGTVFQKTSDIPISGASVEDNLLKHSIKNSTAADRPYYIYATRLCYFVSDAWT